MSDTAKTDYLAEFPKKDHDKFRRSIGELLVSNGFYEIWTNSLTNKTYQEKNGTPSICCKTFIIFHPGYHVRFRVIQSCLSAFLLFMQERKNAVPKIRAATIVFILRKDIDRSHCSFYC